MSDIYFCSDHHFGHIRMIDICNRPFNNVEHMNQELVQRHNSVVKPNDIVYMIGDITLKMEPSKLYKIIQRMNGYKIFIAGNHDAPNVYKYFDEFHSSLVKEFDGLGKCLLVHHPVYPPNPTKETYPELEWRVSYGPVKMNKDTFNIDDYDLIINGHIHQCWKTNYKSINVCLDVHDWRPVSLDQMIELKKEVSYDKP